MLCCVAVCLPVLSYASCFTLKSSKLQPSYWRQAHCFGPERQGKNWCTCKLTGMYNTCISVLTSRRSVIERLKILNSEVSLNDEAICWQRKKQQTRTLLLYRCSDTELAHDQSNVHYTLQFHTCCSSTLQHSPLSYHTVYTMSNKLKLTKMVAIMHLENIFKNNKYKLGTFLRNQPFNQHAAIACALHSPKSADLQQP